MPSLLGSISTVRSAMLSFQQGMAVTSHNLANAQTDGYSRQRANLQSINGIDYQHDVFGFGVDVASVTRSRDEFIDRGLRAEHSDLQRSTVVYDQLTQISEALGDPVDGAFANSISSFFSAWSDLANAPESLSARAAVRDAGVSMTTEFHRMSEQCNRQIQESNQVISNGVQAVNRIASALAELNRRIVHEVSNGRQPNDLMDERDRMLDELSQWGNISIQTRDDGALRVHFGDFALVDGENVTRISSTRSSSGTHIVWENSAREVTLNSGKIAGARDLADQVNRVIEQLNQAAVSLVASVNSIHRVGRGRDQSTGVNFFAAGSSSAGDIRLDAEVLSNSARIAASGAQGVSDGLTARAIAAVREQGIMNGDTLQASLAAMAGGLGSSVNLAKAAQEQANAGMQQLDNWRQSVSGVSLDEEMMNMLRHQQAYAAAGKAFSTVNSMLDTLFGILK